MENVVIKKYGINGEGIGYVDKKPLFVEHALDQETVKVEITKKEKTYAIGRCVEVVKASRDRVKPACPYFEQCGGCALMHASMGKQAKIKKSILEESLEKYAGLYNMTIPVKSNPVPLTYRNQLKMPFAMVDGKITTGFFKRNTNYFLEIPHCIVHEQALETMRVSILKVVNQFRLPLYEKGKRDGLRFLILRILDGKIQCTFVTSQYEFKPEFVSAIAGLGVASIHQSLNTKAKSHEIMVLPLRKLYGQDSIEFKLQQLRISCHPFSFYQLNSKQASRLYEKVVSLIKPCTTLVETYCGLGAMSLLVADKAKEVFGSDTNPASIENAKQNAKRNKIMNTHFSTLDSAEHLKRLSKKKNIDYVIVDPPRSGLDDAMIETLMRGKIKQVIYISCNPSTLGKNLGVLKSKYIVEEITLFDMFSQTQHVETVVLLRRR